MSSLVHNLRCIEDRGIQRKYIS